MSARLLAVLVLLLAAGCQPAPAAAVPAVTPQVLQVDLTASLRDLSPILSGCARQQGTLGLVINEQTTQNLDKGTGPLRMRWGAPAKVNGYAAVLATENLAVIVNPANPLTNLTRAQLRAMYNGNARSWKDLPDCPECSGNALAGKEIHAWAYSPGEDIQQIFESALGLRVPSSAAGLVPHPQAALQAVANDPEAVSFLPARLVDDTVRAISVQQIPTDALARPILALSPAEPQGLTREWLGCVQEKLGE